MGTSIRGKKVFQTLIWPEDQLTDGVQDDRRGRSPEWIERRNDHLLYRYWWYSKDGRSNMVWVYERLSWEFYITPSTIGQLIEDNLDTIAAIKKEGLTDKELRAKFSWW
jgi:hypothetical protein